MTVSEHRPSMATVQTTEGGSAVPSLAGAPVNADLYHSLSLVQSSQKESIRSEVSHFLTVSNPEPSSGPPKPNLRPLVDTPNKPVLLSRA